MLQTLINNIDYSKIFRVYTEGEQLILWLVDDGRIVFDGLTTENMNAMREMIVSSALESRYYLEVYNGLNEAKSH